LGLIGKPQQNQLKMNRKDKKKLARLAKSVDVSVQNAGQNVTKPGKSGKSSRGSLPVQWFYAAAAILLPLTLWAYWPTFVWMEDQWRNEADYSHGYLVIPLALLLLHFRKHTFPGMSHSISWLGASLLFLAIAMRIAGRFAYMDFIDGWTLIPWVGGIVWMFCGWRVFKWALPALVFLIFLVPMPFRVESMLSWQLQGVATKLSVAMLRIIGFPVVPEGNTIWLEDHQLMVEEACSGLRIFVGMIAIGFWYAVVSERHWTDRVVTFFAALPIALIVNAIRISATVLAFHFLSGAMSHVAHDLLGWLMIAAGAGLLYLARAYWQRLYRYINTTIIPINVRPI
jgi:exosortase